VTLPPTSEPPVEDEAPLYCHWHPKVETALRCYQCGTPICTRCAHRTPVGYLCPDCYRGRQARFEQARATDYVIASVVSLVGGGMASILPLLGSWWFILFLSPLAGTLLAELVWRLVGRRYGRYLWWIVAGGLVVGALPVLGLTMLRLLGGTQAGWWGLQGLLIWCLHVGLAVGTVMARLRLK